MFAYGMIIAMIGALAYHASDYKSSSPLWVSNIVAVLSVSLAAGMRDLTIQRGQDGYKVLMACIHLSMILPLLVSCLLGWRLYLAMQVPEKHYVIPFFTADIILSAIAVLLIVVQKPKSSKTAEARPKTKTDKAKTDRSFFSQPAKKKGGPSSTNDQAKDTEEKKND
eukprot:CAMPEP_0198727354 /NCGR_PEP_ID=MMETSP1475-20131203/4109_1 /TAXON_ID= ORGANISM="Unidentified sp., Strain CCMP1999" /NCGR_SAMPLE_ID=MMETSP1475 /ASSEMBLY_ACC=CAM_ASM_001111 /LENGTH=166 /DNA_ID=CAMNT_0044489385 /DNA_START=72 /DNA_END=572 /DNA_ORIENTATION=+